MGVYVNDVHKFCEESRTGNNVKLFKGANKIFKTQNLNLLLNSKNGENYGSNAKIFL